MSSGGVDERIRAVLDLGDSSGAVKALDTEVEKLLADFKKQTEAFEQGKVAPKDFADSVSKLKSELGGLKGAMQDLGGGSGGGGGDVFENVNRKLFALERGMSNLVGGTGLGRAGGLLESGIALFGGPAGLGFALAMFANTLENVLPKLEGFWAHLWNKMTADEIHEKLQALSEQGKKAKEMLDSVFARPAPGQEAFGAHQAAALQGAFNIQTQREGLEQGVQNVLRRGGLKGQAEETSEVKDLRRQQEDIRRSTEFPDDPHIQALILGLENQIRKITSDNILRRASELMLNAQKEGPEGRQARKELMEMIRSHADLFKGAGGLIEKLRQADEAPYHPPTPEAIDQDRQDRLERAQQQFGRASRASQQRALQFTIESGGMEFEGPPAPRLSQMARERRRLQQRRRVHRRRTGLTEGQAGPPRPPIDLRRTGAVRGAPAPHGREGEFAGIRKRPDLAFRNADFSRETAQHQAMREAEAAQRRATAEFADIKRMQQNAISLEQKGLSTHEKTQRTVAGLQTAMDKLWARMQVLDQNANNLLQRQQRTQQNTTGN